jgi:hypothetical protein
MPRGIGVGIFDQNVPTMLPGSTHIGPLTAGESVTIGARVDTAPTVIFYEFYDGFFEPASGPEGNVPLGVSLEVPVPSCGTLSTPAAADPSTGATLPATR